MKKFLLIAALITIAVGAMAQKYTARVKSPKELLNDRYTSGLFKNAEGTIFDIENETL